MGDYNDITESRPAYIKNKTGTGYQQYSLTARSIDSTGQYSIFRTFQNEQSWNKA